MCVSILVENLFGHNPLGKQFLMFLLFDGSKDTLRIRIALHIVISSAQLQP